MNEHRVNNGSNPPKTMCCVLKSFNASYRLVSYLTPSSSPFSSSWARTHVREEGNDGKKNTKKINFQSMSIKFELMNSSHNWGNKNGNISEGWESGGMEKVCSFQGIWCFIMENENFLFELHHISHPRASHSRSFHIWICIINETFVYFSYMLKFEAGMRNEKSVWLFNA